MNIPPITNPYNPSDEESGYDAGFESVEMSVSSEELSEVEEEELRENQNQMKAEIAKKKIDPGLVEAISLWCNPNNQ